MQENISEFPKNPQRCNFCKKQATKLCDMIKGYSHSFHMAKLEDSFKTEHITCDKYICDKCAINIGIEIDFCPDCIKLIKIKSNKQDTSM